LEDAFNKASQKSEAEIFLESQEIPYEKLPDGTLKAYGSITLRRMDLERLPDLSNVIVEGSFDCAKNGLTSLKGAPKEVDVFDCSRNNLTSLEGAPEKFSLLASDFIVCESWDEIPEDLRYSQETRERMQKEAAEAAAAEEERIKRVSSPALLRDLPATKPLVPR